MDDSGESGERPREDIGEAAYGGEVEADTLGRRGIASQGVDAPADERPVQEPAHQKCGSQKKKHGPRESIHDSRPARSPKEVPA